MRSAPRAVARLIAAAITALPLAARCPAVAQVPARPGPGAGPAAPASPEGVSVRPEDNTAGDQTQKLVPAPISPPPRAGLFTEAGKTLLDRGIDIHGTAFDHFLANPSAGVYTGRTSNLAALRPAIDLDLERLVGIPGGTVRLGLSFFGLRSNQPQIAGQAGGVLTGFQTTPTLQTNLVSLLTYEQRLLGGKLSIEAGRTNVYNYFFLPNSLDPFTHYSGTMQVVGDFPPAPYPVWGARVTYKLTPAWYVQGGAFEDNYRRAVLYGDRLGTKLSTGAQLLGEVGYRTDFSTAAYPANLEAGFEWNTRTGRANLKGTSAPANALLQPANYPGGGVIFVQGQQTIWRGAQSDVGPPANIAVYGSFNVSVSKPQPIDLDAMLGVNFTGFIPGRPSDALGLQAKYQRLSQVEVNAETRKQRIVAGPGIEQARDGLGFEVVANIQVAPAVALRPLVQYFVQPDNYYPPAAVKPGRPKDGFEAGLFAVVSLGRLLGTSAKPF